MMASAACARTHAKDLENYIKEIFLDSDTTVAIISGIPSSTEPSNILPPDEMAETREIVNRLAASRRVVTHARRAFSVRTRPPSSAWIRAPCGTACRRISSRG
jgi:hypothetical protein